MKSKPDIKRHAAATHGRERREAGAKEEDRKSPEFEQTGEIGGEENRNKRQQTRRLWMNGVVVMAGAALLSKFIGVFQKIPLQNLAGDRVFGIFNAVYPFYQLAAVLATAGLPTAVSLLIAEKLRGGNDADGARRTLYAALLLLGATGIAAFGFMWAGAGEVSRWIGDSETARAIRAISAALLLAPVVAVLRGYAQGLGRMALSAASQVVEQMVRVTVMLLVLAVSWSAGWADADVAAGVMSGSAIGASVSLLVLAGFSWRGRRRDRLVRAKGAIIAEIRRLAAIAFPVALGAVVVPAIGVVDAFTVPRLLRENGLVEAEAMAMFGIYSRAQPLVQLVAMVAGAAAAALVPGLAHARMRGDYVQLRFQLSLTERAAWAIGAAAAIGIWLLAEPLNVMLYEDAKGTAAFALIGCTALAGSVNAVTAPVLQAMGTIRTPALLLLVAALLKGALNAAFVPFYGIEGAALAGVAALSLVALLGAFAVRRAASGAVGSAWLRFGGSEREREEELAERWSERVPEEERSGERGSERGRGEEWSGERGSERERAEERWSGRPRTGRAAAGTCFALAVMAVALLIAERVLGAALGGLLPPRAAATALALTGVAVGACAFSAAALRGGAISARELRALPGGGAWAARLRRWRLLPPAERER
ncbi:oligosaccharide flippase family protein [Paenibacillus harenae]|uniref:oligosaccharide flippase family protein n=1 Tax=Paenibacillus harenae TaxID=306543 RepID=UPI00040A3D75|nr:oligosaccharide flippase family protein [Paenibacillus harenae]